MRWFFLIERYRTVTNVTGTVIVAWLLSAIVCQAIATLIPDTSSAAVNSFDVPGLEAENAVYGEGTGDVVASYMRICERNLFDSQKRTPCTEEVQIATPTEEVDPNAPPVKSDLAYTLLGTMVSTVPTSSFATLTPRGGQEAKNYRVEQQIDDATITEIVRNRVYLRRGGRMEYLEVENLPPAFSSAPSMPLNAPPPGGDGVRVEGDKVIVARAKVEATLGDLNKVIQESRMVPNLENGTVTGFKIFAIKPGSIFQQIGLRNGDVIHRINGNDINSVEKALPMLQAARNESSITIDLTRQGAKKTVSVDIQ